MIVNDAGRKIIMDSERLELKAYRCPAGVWTIGWGHTGDVQPNHVITRHEAEAVLEVDLQRFELGVSELAPKANANQFSALVSLAFNIGLAALGASTLLRLFNAGLPVAAAQQFAKWIHAGGKVMPGLVKRRAAEAALFMRLPS